MPSEALRAGRYNCFRKTIVHERSELTSTKRSEAELTPIKQREINFLEQREFTPINNSHERSEFTPQKGQHNYTRKTNVHERSELTSTKRSGVNFLQ